ncbi:MAG TPA: outer membrane beta-barrel protein [Pseudomonadales bacterium]
MNKTSVPAVIAASTIAAGVLVAASAHVAAATDPFSRPAPSTTDPFQAEVFVGATYDDNLFRLENEEEALDEIGDDQLEDWYYYYGAGFQGNFAGDRRRFALDGQIYRQEFDEQGFLDHTGGRLNANGEWALSSDTDGLLGYGYQRRLQSFTNKANTDKDVIDQHGFTAGIEHTLAQRWQLRLGGGWTDLDFSTSDFLDKERIDAEAEIRYAASQKSIFGLLATWTQSDFDDGDTRDFSGWSVGPSFEWQLTSRFQLSANIGYTHRGLDESGGTLEDFDGVTGFVAALWEPGERFSHELRAFREISNLGGEVSEYTKLTGVRWRPRWQLTPKLSTRLALTFEERDFTAIEGLPDREDDYLLADLWFDFDATQRLLVSLGYTYETRDSNEPEEEFDAHVFRGELRFRF